MPTDSPQRAIVAAARRVLRPLVRQMIHHGVTFPAANRLLKQVFIEVAEEEGKLPRRKLSDSRVSLITGVPRKEVAHLRGTREVLESLPLEAHLATRLISRWQTEPRFRTPDGEAQILPFESSDGSPSFSELVKHAGGDIPARAVLDELVRVGAVEVSPAREISLRVHRYIPAAGTLEKIDMLGTDAAEFIETISHNILSAADDAYLQQKIEFDNVGSRGVPILRRRLRQMADGFLRRVEELMALYDRDRNPQAPGGERTRVVMGAYYFQDEEVGREKKGDRK